MKKINQGEVKTYKKIASGIVNKLLTSRCIYKKA